MPAVLLLIALLGFAYLASRTVHGLMTADPRLVREAESTFKEEGCPKAIDVLYSKSAKVNNFTLRKAWAVFQSDHQERYRQQKREEAKQRSVESDKED